MNFAVRLTDAIDRHPLALMAPGAAEFIGRMSVIGEQHFAARVSPERMGFLFESRPVDRQMASYAAVDARHRLIEAVTVEFIERDLLNLGVFYRMRTDQA